MLMREWTNSQKNAINARNRNILVSAAAGSGKTAVLVERVIRMITDTDNPVDIDSLLIVTFTNAAAAEMKYKISQALNERIRNTHNSPQLTQLYRRQLTLLPNAQISTIDSFCNSLVKEYFYELSINQDFSIIDDSQHQILQDNVISEVIDDYFESEDKDFIALFDQFAKPGDEKNLVSMVKKILSYIYAEPFPYRWLRDSIELYNPNISFYDSIWYKYIFNEINELFDFALSLTEDCLTLFKGETDPIALKLIDTINDDISVINSIRKRFASSWDDCYEFYKDKPKFKNAPPSTKYEDQVTISKFKAIRESYKNIIQSDIMSFFITDTANYYEDMKIAYKQLNSIFKLVKSVDEKLLNEKREINQYSFNDILHFAIDLLFKCDDDGKIIKTKLADDLSSSYHEILVDEYQDTNEAQDLLFSYLSNGKNLFTVGDIKQSIYRFRLAMPNIFNNKKKHYSHYNENDTSSESKIILDKNFRSRKDICSYVNFIFSNLMTEKVGELDYNKDEYLNYGANYSVSDVPSAQIKIVNGVSGEDTDLIEATYIAKTIQNKIDAHEQIRDGDTYRDVNYGDFTILLRKAKGHINTYAQVLEEHNIPVISDNSSNLFENNEIQILLSLIKTIDNPMLDIPLLATMMSPIYGFTADEMAQIRIENKYKSLYSAVLNSKNPKAIAFIDDIKSIRTVSVSMSVAAFIRYLIDDKGLISLFNAMGNGEQRYQNVQRLITFAKRFDSGVNVGLTAFVRYIDKIQKSDKGIDSPALNTVSNNSVKIMTVHHSKGLEFPICIFAGSGRDFNRRELNDSLLLNSSYGVGIKCHNEKLLCQYSTLPYLVIKNKISYEMMSENLRVLYVAMTRAKEQFITFITDKNIEKKIVSLSAKIGENGVINPYHVKKINKDGDLLLLCALLHKDADAIRSLLSYEIKPLLTDFTLDVEIKDEVVINADDNCIEYVPYDNDIVKAISDKLSFNYKGAELSSLSSKLAASSLDTIDTEINYIASSKPAFLSKNSLTPAQRGTAMHSFLQFADYISAKNDIYGEIDKIIAAGHLSDDEAQSLDIKRLKHFFDSELMSEILSADRVYRETKVSMFVSTREIYNTISDEKVLVQGIADLVIEKDNELTLIDYKTDNVKSDQELLDRYEKQIMFYKSAISKTLCKPVKSALLYSFGLEKCCYYK